MPEKDNQPARRDYISPRQLAAALGVSESSIKRWCDREVLKAVRTAGGHRRVTLAAVWEFMKTTNRTLKDPTALGLPAYGAASPRTIQSAANDLADALEEGDRRAAARVVFDQYLVARRPLGQLFDELLATAFHRIGADWECGVAEVYHERRACDIAVTILGQLGELIAVPPESPLALGGALEGDQYQIPTKMAELTLRDKGWQATSLGNNLPVATLQAAITALKPQLVWVSCSYVASVDQLRRDFRALWTITRSVEASMVVGGRAIDAATLEALPYAHYCANMRHLQQLSPELLRLHSAARAPGVER